MQLNASRYNYQYDHGGVVYNLEVKVFFLLKGIDEQKGKCIAKPMPYNYFVILC